MRREERPRLDAGLVVQVLRHGPRDGDAVEGRGAAADLVQDDERARRGVVEDVGRLLHLDEEGRAAAREVVGRADAREDAVDEPDAGGVGGDEAAGLREDGDEGDLAQVGGLAGHVRAGDDEYLARGAVEARVVRDEALGAGELLDDRVAAAADVDGVALVDLGADVAEGEGSVGEGAEHVEARDGVRDALDLARAGDDVGAELLEEALLELEGLLLGAGDELFALLEGGRGEAFAAGDRLLAQVVVGDGLELRGGDLDEVAEDAVVADLEVLDAGAGGLGGLVLGDPRAAVGLGVAEGVELGREAAADDPAVGERRGELVGEGAVNLVGELRERKESAEDLGEEGRSGGRGGEALAQGRDGAEGGGDGGDVARAAAAERDAGDGAGEVADGGERGAQGREGGAAGDEGADGVEARVDRGLVAERAAEPGAQEARAHRRAGRVEDLVERGAGVAACAVREEVEVGARRFVERHVPGGGAEREAANVRDVAVQVLAHATQEGAGGRVERGAALAAEAVERGDAEVAQELVVGRDGVEVPFVDGRHAGDAGLGEGGEDLVVARLGRSAGAVRDDRLAGREARKGGGELRAAGGRLAEELARRELEDADDEALGALAGLGDDGDEVVVGVLGEERLLGDGARGDDAGDLAADHAAALDALRVLHLVADGGLEAGADDLGEIGVEGVVRDAAHRLAGAVGEGEAEKGGGAAGVVHEQLVEVPEAEEEQRVAVQVLPHRAVLAQHRGEFFGHFVRVRRAPQRAAQSSRTHPGFQPIAPPRAFC